MYPVDEVRMKWVGNHKVPTVNHIYRFKLQQVYYAYLVSHNVSFEPFEEDKYRPDTAKDEKKSCIKHP